MHCSLPSRPAIPTDRFEVTAAIAWENFHAWVKHALNVEAEARVWRARSAWNRFKKNQEATRPRRSVNWKEK